MMRVISHGVSQLVTLLGTLLVSHSSGPAPQGSVMMMMMGAASWSASKASHVGKISGEDSQHVRLQGSGMMNRSVGNDQEGQSGRRLRRGQRGMMGSATRVAQLGTDRG